MDLQKTIGKLFLNRTKVAKNKNAIGWIENDQLKFLTFKEYRKIIEALTYSLLQLGIKQGEKIAILAENCKEWHFCDLAILCARGIVVPINSQHSPEEIVFILKHSESSVLVVEDSLLLNKILSQVGSLEDIKIIISFLTLTEDIKSSLPSNVSIIEYQSLLQKGLQELEKHNFNLNYIVQEQMPNEVATIIYSSGTTSNPRGSMITHHALVSTLNNIKDFSKGSFSEQDRTLTFLPLSHIFGRIDSMLPLVFQWEMVFSSSLEKLLLELDLVRPTILLVVPKIFENIYQNIQNKIDMDHFIQKKLFNWAFKVASQYHKKIQEDLSPTPKEIFNYKLAQRLVFTKYLRIFGDNIRFLFTGGSPISVKVFNFFRNMGLSIIEGYGLTETIAPCTLNPLSKQIPSTAGIPIGDVQIKFSNEQEILIKTQGMFLGYYKDEEKTNEVFKDGWFHSGDIGRYNSDGYLEIIDRKSNLIILKSGHKVYPQKIETLMKSQRYIGQIVVIGDNHPYLTAIVGVEKASLLPIIFKLGIPTHSTVSELVQNPNIYNLIKIQIEEVNNLLPMEEQIKKFIVSPDEFSIENGFLTPTLKIKRQFIVESFSKEIELLYQSKE